MKIDGQTKTAGIFGDPIAHTLSPAMHNAAFRALGMNAVYLPFHVKAASKGALRAAVEAVRAMDMLGVNVTIPHKELVLKYLDEVDGQAASLGAVNTIVNRGGRLFGFNTDGAGYLLSLKKETGFRPAGKKVVIIGAGGAARSILYSMLELAPSSVVLVNRTAGRAATLAREFAPRFSSPIVTAALERAPLEKALDGADLVVNTTSIGMMGKGELELPLEAMKARAVVSDIVYRPLRTGLLKDAGKKGLRAHGGLGMLIGQGAIGFELWTSRAAPVAVMEKAALGALRKR